MYCTPVLHASVHCVQYLRFHCSWLFSAVASRRRNVGSNLGFCLEWQFLHHLSCPLKHFSNLCVLGFKVCSDRCCLLSSPNFSRPCIWKVQESLCPSVCSLCISWVPLESALSSSRCLQVMTSFQQCQRTVG